MGCVSVWSIVSLSLLRLLYVCNADIVKPSEYKIPTPRRSKSWICVVCGRKFEHAALLELHIATGPCGKPVHRSYSCPYCEFTSSSLTSFAHHKRRHRDGDSFHCKLCGYRCANVEALKRHLEFCLDLKSAKCFVCHHKFKRESVRDVHMMSHVEVYRYECKTCSYRCRRFALLWGHLKNRHPHVSLWCHVCNKIIRESPWHAGQSSLAVEVARTQYSRHLRQHFPFFVNLTLDRVKNLNDIALRRMRAAAASRERRMYSKAVDQVEPSQSRISPGRL